METEPAKSTKGRTAFLSRQTAYFPSIKKKEQDNLGSDSRSGYVFTPGLDVSVRYQHYSNGGYAEPNDGVNMVVVRLRYGF
ncbi:MAG: acyloxyacyl hydrolase [Burkholderiaceae bacterium]